MRSASKVEGGFSLVEVAVAMGLLGLLVMVWMGSLVGAVATRRALEQELVATCAAAGFLDEAQSHAGRRMVALGPRGLTEFRWIRAAFKIDRETEANAIRVVRRVADPTPTSRRVTVAASFRGRDGERMVRGEVHVSP